MGICEISQITDAQAHYYTMFLPKSTRSIHSDIKHINT